MVLQYGDSVRSRIVFSLVKQKVSGGQEQEQVFVAMELTRYLGYDGDNSTCPQAAPSDSDYYQP